MDFKLSEEKARFLQLAMKKISGTASRQERTELAALIEASPDLELHYDDMLRELNWAREEGFIELSLRVLFKKANPQEISQIRALKETDPTGWRNFQELGFMLQSLGENSPARSTKKQTSGSMPETVRKRLLSGLRAKQRKK
jgi:hypothetical protein